MKFDFSIVISLVVLPTIMLGIGAAAQTGQPWAGQVLSESMDKSLSTSPNLDKSETLTPAQFDVGIPFSFIYGSKHSSELLPEWQCREHKSDFPNGKRVRTVTFTDIATGLEVSCETTTFEGFPAAD
ncbi:MAG: hypothetical protein ACYC0V_06830, partial [Armatimonadota bacterium]